MKIILYAPIYALLLCSSLFALDLDESVNLALQRSYKIKEQKMKLQRLRAELGIYEGSYYPKIDFAYKAGYEIGSSEFGNKASLGMELNLFNGLKDKNAIAMQESMIYSQEEEVRRVQEEIKYMTQKLYVQILLAKGSLEISKESAHLLELQLKQAQQFYKQGISAKNNVLSVEVSLASARLEINAHTTRLNYLFSAIKEMIERDFELSDLKDLPLCEDEVDYDRLSLIVFEHKPEYKAMQRQKEALRYAISAARGNYYPKVDLNVLGDYGFGGKYYRSQAFIGLGLSLNLFNGLKDSKGIEAKQYELLGLESRISAYKKDVLTELKRAVGEFNLARDQYILSKKTIENAQENYRIVSNRYKQKLETSSDLLDAELMLKNAKANLLKTHYALWENLFYVEYLMGGNRGVFF